MKEFNLLEHNHGPKLSGAWVGGKGPILAGLMVLSGVSVSFGQSFNSLRIAMYQLGPTNASIPAGFLDRAKAAGYNYILVEYSLAPHASDWTNGIYTGSAMRQGLANAFAAVNAKGMKLIPLFQSGSNHSGHWDSVKNPNMSWEYVDHPNTNQRSDCPVFAPDANGFDLSFLELMRVIRDAYTNSGIGGSLEYLHIAHDESIHHSTGTFLIGNSAEDAQWMASNPGNGTHTSLQLLMADEMARRVAAVRSVLPNTKVMAYGDMWDPQLNGAPIAFNLSNAITAPVVQAVSIKPNLIFAPWWYDKCHIPGGFPGCASHPVDDWDYNTAATFDHFKNAGFKLVFQAALTDANADATPSRLYQNAELMTTAWKPAYRSSIIGFVSSNWSGAWNSGNSLYNQQKCFQGLEFISHMHYYGSPN